MKQSNSTLPHGLPTRRMLLRTAGSAGLTLAAASALSPFVFSDQKKETVKVGILNSLTGTIGYQERPLHDAALLAIEEINQKGGVLGKTIKAIVEDPASRFMELYPDKAKKLLVTDKVAAVFGGRLAVGRKNILPVFESNNGLLFFPAFSEGNECSKNVVYGGTVFNQQIKPAIDWFLKQGKKKWYLLGSDVSYPRHTNFYLEMYLKSLKATDAAIEVKRVKYSTLGSDDYAEIVVDVKRSGADVLFLALEGDSNIAFFEELASQGLTPDKVPVLSATLNEADLLGMKPDKVKGHYVARSYFQSIDTPTNKAFVKSFKAKFGADQVVHDDVEAAYFQVYFWKSAVEKAKSFDVDKVRTALRGLEIDAPGGKVKVDGKNQYTWKRFRLGKIREDRQFDIVTESKEWIPPDPYPQVALPGWGCDWTRGGVIRGQTLKLPNR